MIEIFTRKKVLRCATALTAMMLLSASFFFADSGNDFKYDSHGKKDPFAPPRAPEVTADGEAYTGGLKLEGIIFDSLNGSLAIINGKVVRKGDEIHSYRVMAITEALVTLAREDEVFSLKLQKDE